MSDTYLIPQFIIDYLQKSKSTKNPQKLAPASLKKNKTPEIEKWFEENEVTASYIWKFFVFYGLDRFSFRECAVCGKRIKLSTILKYPDAKYCSRKCMANSEEIKNKLKATNVKKYGVEYPMQSKTVQEKWKQTCLERYGAEHTSKLKENREKVKQTCLAKYGVENPFQNKEIQEKKKQTNLKRYGVEYPTQTKEIQEKKKQTCLEKYGVEFVSQTKEFKEEMKQTRRSNRWETFCSQLSEKDIIPLFSKEEYINDTGRKFKCLICNKEFESEGTNEYMKMHKNKDGTYTTLITYSLFCPHCIKRCSKKEKEVLEFVKSIYGGEVTENDRIQLEGKELDIFLPALNLGIEFDGDYWHSLKNVQERDATKTKLCEEKGIKLLRIREEDWDNNRQSVKEKIKEFLGIK